MGSILILETESAVATMIWSLLRRHGYEAVTAMSTGQALELLTENHIDLLLLDIDVPNGRDFMEGARLINPTLPVCYMGAAPEVGGVDIGIDCWIQRPFDIDRFLETVQEMLGPRESQ